MSRISSNAQTLTFPETFHFGSAVSSFQVEGNISDERATDWDRFLVNHPNEIIKPGETGPNWWAGNRAEKDLQQMKRLGLTMQRLSLEWARIEPKKGQINMHAIARYQQILAYLSSLKIVPAVTIHHFTLPDWIEDQGGWENPKTIADFEDFVRAVCKHFPDIHYWIIINEPAVQIKFGYLLGFNPPKKQSLISTIYARKNLMTANKRAYAILKSLQPESMVGSAFFFGSVQKIKRAV